MSSPKTKRPLRVKSRPSYEIKRRPKSPRGTAPYLRIVCRQGKDT